MDIQIKDLPYDIYGHDKEVHYFDNDKHRLYKVNIYLIGLDLAFIDNVTYLLHKTFKNSEKRVFRTISNQHCKLSLWAWGKFEVKATVEDGKGRRFIYNHFLNFDKHFEDEGVKFIKAR